MPTRPGRPIRTARLTVRNFAVEDGAALREILLQREASDYAAYDHVWPTTVHEVVGLVNWLAKSDQYLAVCLTESGELIGFVSLSPAVPDRTDAFDLGYVFSSNHHGCGYATEACRALLEYAFDKLGAQAVTSATAAANIPSCRLLNRLGFRVTGEHQYSFRTEQTGAFSHVTGRVTITSLTGPTASRWG